MTIGLDCPRCGKPNIRPDRRGPKPVSEGNVLRIYQCQDCQLQFMVNSRIVTEEVAQELEEVYNGDKSST
jgi:transposase-like protein